MAVLDIGRKSPSEERAVKFLVTDSDGKTHLPYTDASGNPDHRLCGAAFAALTNGYRGNKYAGPSKAEALAKLKKIYAAQAWDLPSESKNADGDWEYRWQDKGVTCIASSKRSEGSCNCDCAPCLMGLCGSCCNTECNDPNCDDCPIQAGRSNPAKDHKRAATDSSDAGVGCSCGCQNCMEGNCDVCTGKGCDDPNCKKCPIQAERSMPPARAELRAMLRLHRDFIERAMVAKDPNEAPGVEQTYRELRRCYGACRGAGEYADTMYGDSTMPKNLHSSLRDAMGTVGLCGDLSQRGSPLTAEAHGLTASACRALAGTCGGDHGHEMIRACGDVAMRCADHCASMATALKGQTEGEEARTDRRAGDETRSFKCEFRAAGDGHIVGYPIRFGEFSLEMGGDSRGASTFREIIAPGAITFDVDLRADYNHNSDHILGRVAAGTLKASIDDRGVLMDANPPEDAQWYKDLRISMERGDVTQGSFSFRVLPDGQQLSTDANGQQVRTLTKILVRRLSVVSDPAYVGTSVEVRSGDQLTGVEASKLSPHRFRRLRLRQMEAEN
jgi:HK97 family phage prohead protease